MEVDDSTRFRRSSLSSKIFQARICSQDQCAKMLPPEYLSDICEQCMARSNSPFMKRKRSFRDVSTPTIVDPFVAQPSIQLSLSRPPRPTSWKPPAGSNEKVESLTRSSRVIGFGHPLRHHPSHPGSRRDSTHLHGERPRFLQPRPLHPLRAAATRRSSYDFMPAQTAVPHFNARGELIQPLFPPGKVPPSTVPVDYPSHPMHPRHDMRMCARVGCGAIVSSIHLSDICIRCSAVSPSTLSPTPYLQDLGSLAQPHISTSSYPPNPIEQIPPLPPEPESAVTQDVSNALSKITNGDNDDMDGIEFLYPEEPPEPESESSTPRPELLGLGLNHSRHSTPLHIPLPRRPLKASSVLKPPIEPSQKRTPKPIPDSKPSSNDSYTTTSLSGRLLCLSQHYRVCDTPECESLLQQDAATTRCFGCIMKDWKARSVVLEKDGKGKKKSVSWAQMVSVRVDGEEDAFSVPLRQSPEVEETIAVDQEVDFSSEDESSNTPVTRHQPPASDSTQQTHRLTIRIMPTNHLRSRLIKAASGEMPDGDQPILLEPRLNEEPPISKTDAGTSITGWDSDLTDLSSSSNEGGEPEVDLSSDSDQSLKPSGLKIRLPARTVPSVVRGRACSIKKCQRSLPADYRWKSCVTCRAHHRKYQRRRQGLQSTHPFLDIEAESYAAASSSSDTTPVPPLDLGAPLLTPGARLCATENCVHIIPSIAEYRWKMCEPCCAHTRILNRQRKEAKFKGATEPTLPGTPGAVAVDNYYSDDPDDVPLAASLVETMVGNGSRALNRCSSRDCGILLDPGTTGIECIQCLTRRLAVNQLDMTRIPSRIPRSSKEAKRKHGYHQSHTPKASKSSAYSQYKCLSVLLSDLTSRLSGFLEAQAYYLALTTAGRKRPQPAAFFAFDGEFSVVSLDFDILRRKEDVNRGTLKLKEEIEKLGGLRFSSTNWVSVVDGGIVRRFTCIHETPAALPKAFPQQPTLKVHPKSMQGELEVAVVGDRSHRFFPGQRTIVRFRLVG